MHTTNQIESGVQFVNTKDLHHFSEILTGLEPDFDKEHYPYILTYCNIIPNDKVDQGKMWKVWLGTRHGFKLGMCGIYSCFHNDDVAWIGWFGVLPEYRFKGVGIAMMNYMQKKAKEMGYAYLATYMFKDDGPVDWYMKRGFEAWSMDDRDKEKYRGYVDGDYVIRKVL